MFSTASEVTRYSLEGTGEGRGRGRERGKEKGGGKRGERGRGLKIRDATCTLLLIAHLNVGLHSTSLSPIYKGSKHDEVGRERREGRKKDGGKKEGEKKEGEKKEGEKKEGGKKEGGKKEGRTKEGGKEEKEGGILPSFSALLWRCARHSCTGGRPSEACSLSVLLCLWL